MLSLGLTVLTHVLNATPDAAVCQKTPIPVVVDTRTRQLFLCQKGMPAEVYRVNLGQGGVGKKKQGDQKTPLGVYSLQLPRKSNSGFTWFVPVGYPTSEQKKNGYTGGSIGIHGPPDWIPSLVVKAAFMVATREEIEAIRRWLLTNKATQILIL